MRSTTERFTSPAYNSLLQALPPEERRNVLDLASASDFQAGDVLYEAETRISHVYFPLRGVASLITPMSGGEQVETAMVGYEGMIGIAVFLGGGSSGTGRAIWQVPGHALVTTADHLRAHVDSGGKLRQLLFGYTQALFSQISQSTACNALHHVVQRCARWLLQTHDRAREDEFQLTHEFLATMLAVRRASVTEAAGQLQDAGLITYRRGIVTVLDRDALEQASCECYGLVKREYERLVPLN
jgi:CRP-like cAMP-binding protein